MYYFPHLRKCYSFNIHSLLAKFNLPYFVCFLLAVNLPQNKIKKSNNQDSVTGNNVALTESSGNGIVILPQRIATICSVTLKGHPNSFTSHNIDLMGSISKREKVILAMKFLPFPFLQGQPPMIIQYEHCCIITQAVNISREHGGSMEVR